MQTCFLLLASAAAFLGRNWTPAMAPLLVALAMPSAAAPGPNDPVPLTLTWKHATLFVGLTINGVDGAGNPIVATNEPTVFTIYRSYDISFRTNWFAIGRVTNTGTFSYTNSPFGTAFFAVTASNSVSGETPFSNVATATLLSPASDTRVQRGPQ